jgi:hypothetical protein
MSAVAAEPAFEQDEFVDLPRIGREASMLLDEALQAGRPPVPSGKGDMGVEGPTLGFQSDGLAGPFDLAGQRPAFVAWFDAGPKCPSAAMIEAADAAQP